MDTKELAAEAFACFQREFKQTGNPEIDALVFAAFKAGFGFGGQMAINIAIALTETDRNINRIKKESNE